MIALLFLLISIWLGLVLADYLLPCSANCWERFSSALILGTFFSTWLTFILSLLFGFSIMPVVLGFLLMFAAAGFLWMRQQYNFAWLKQNVLTGFPVTVTYAVLFLLVMPYFLFSVWQSPGNDILFRGNMIDLPYHLSMIHSFLEQGVFPPENPQCAGAKLSYHFMVNFHAAILHSGGWNLFLSALIPQALFAFCLIILLVSFYKLLSQNNRTLTFIAAVFFISAHIGAFNLLFLWLGVPSSPEPFNPVVWSSWQEQILYPFYNFLNVVDNYFLPQRPFLFALPLALIILRNLYRAGSNKETDRWRLAVIALITGLLPFFHIHTFLIVFPVLVVTILINVKPLRFKALVLLPLVPAVFQFVWLLSDGRPKGFSGWDVHLLRGGIVQLNILNSAILSRLVFWIRAAGFSLLLGMAGLLIVRRKDNYRLPRALLLLVPLIYFVLINFYRFTPNWGDSNKFYLYLHLLLSFYAACFFLWMIRKNPVLRILGVFLLLVSAIIPVCLEGWAAFSIPGTVMFSYEDRKTAEWVKENTPKESVFLCGDDIVHYIAALSGRRVVDGAYTWQTGFRKPGIQQKIKAAYRTGNRRLLQKLGITHVLVGPHEIRKYGARIEPYRQYQMVYYLPCRSGDYLIYKIE